MDNQEIELHNAKAALFEIVMTLNKAKTTAMTAKLDRTERALGRLIANTWKQYNVLVELTMK